MNGNSHGLRNGEIHVYYADLRFYPGGKPENILSPDESATAERYRFEADSLRYVRARCLLRNVLAVYKKCTPEELVFEYAVHGKPGLKGEPSGGVQFNVSHSGDMAAVAVSRGRRVGIDIEKIRDDISASDLSKRFFSDAEIATVLDLHGRARPDLFLRIWTRKEALLKATGEGIVGLSRCPDLMDAGEISLNGMVWQVHDLELAPGYIVALAVEGGGSTGSIRMFPVGEIHPGSTDTEKR